MKTEPMSFKRFSAMALIGCIAIFLSASCGTKFYTINGTVADPSLEGAKVYKTASYSVTEMFADRANFQPQTDSTVIKDEKYSFTGEIAEPDYCNISITVEGEQWPVASSTVVLEPGAKISVVTDADRKTRVSGTAFNEATQQNADAHEAAAEKLMALRERMQAEGGNNEMEAEYEKAYNDYIDVDFQFVKNNINNPGAWAKLYNAGVGATNGDNAIEKMKELISGANERTKQLADYKGIVDRIETLERTMEGQPFTDLEMDTPEGGKMKLSDYAGKGKYILVDFWASWCGPCKAEMPNVVKCYHKYKDRGLDIVSISLDNNKERWVKAIDEWGMPWHHMSDLKGWDCEGAKVYGVTGIPHMMLLDKDGKILARGLYGESLYAKLAEIFPE